MIYYNFITIILLLVIFILILKFRDFKLENYQSLTTSSLTTSSLITSSLDCSNNKNSLDCNILRVMNDSRINNHILQLLKNKINEQSKAEIKGNNEEIDDFLENTEKNKENVDKILKKLRKIDNEYDVKLEKYIDQKEKRNKYLLELTDSLVQNYEDKPFILTNDDFQEKNNKIRNKLAEYYDKIRNLNKKPNTKNKNILILKNTDNKLELNLVDVGKKMRIYNEYKNLNSNLYNLIINDKCLNFVDKYNYQIEKCNVKNNFLFTVNKIENYQVYNKFIMYNKSSRNIHTIDVNQKNVEYPFYLICPFNNIGVCVTYEENKISFNPIRNNPKQRFVKILNSNYCSYE